MPNCDQKYAVRLYRPRMEKNLAMASPPTARRQGLSRNLVRGTQRPHGAACSADRIGRTLRCPDQPTPDTFLVSAGDDDGCPSEEERDEKTDDEEEHPRHGAAPPPVSSCSPKHCGARASAHEPHTAPTISPAAAEYQRASLALPAETVGERINVSTRSAGTTRPLRVWKQSSTGSQEARRPPSSGLARLGLR
jgi:hypothetical protein